MADLAIEGFRQKKAHQDTIVRMRYSPTGRFLVSAGKDGEVMVWSGETLRSLQRFCSSTATLTDVWFSEDETLLFVGHQGGLLHVYEFPKIKLAAEVQLKPERSNPSRILSGTSKPILDYVVMAVCPTGSANIYVALEYRDFFVLSRDNLTVTSQSHWDGNIIEQTAMLPNGKVIFFGDDLGYIYRFTLPDMNMSMFARHREWVTGFDAALRRIMVDASTGIAALALSRDGLWLASTSYSGGVQVWDTRLDYSKMESTGEPSSPVFAKTPQPESRMRGIGFYPDPSRVMAGNDEGRLEVWDCSTKSMLHQAKCQTGIRSLDVSPIDSRCAVGCKDGSIFIVPYPGANTHDQPKNQGGWLRSLFG